MTHICLEVEILEVERVLPDVDANDRDVCSKWVLVGRRDDFKSFCFGIEALSWNVCNLFMDIETVRETYEPSPA